MIIQIVSILVESRAHLELPHTMEKHPNPMFRVPYVVKLQNYLHALYRHQPKRTSPTRNGCNQTSVILAIVDHRGDPEQDPLEYRVFYGMSP